MSVSAAPTAPRVEHRTDGATVLGLGVPSPRLSWTVPSADPGWRQTRYEIEVARAGTVSSFVVASAEQVFVPWPAEPLASRESVELRVRVADGATWSPWSEPTLVEVGLLEADDWVGSFISPAQIGGIDQPAPVLVGRLEVPGSVKSARLYATAHGVYVPSINGQRVDDTVLAPGWTAYEHRLRYQTYDVTDLVRPGTNEVEVLLGNGWFRGYLGYLGERALYGDRLALLAQLEVTTHEGTVLRLVTDGAWLARESEIIRDDLYMGQSTDLRRRAADLPVSEVEIVPAGPGTLVAPDGPPIRPTEVLPARRVWSSPSGRTLVDFGQNAVGWVRLKVRGLPAGTEVTVRHAEVLEDDELGTRPLRAAKATDTYILAGDGQELLEPTLTLHGFRYAEVTGVPDLEVEQIELVVIGSDLERSGWFSCSDDLVEKLHENVVWGTRGNFVDVPTDCPQRDERLGWTGDIQVFAPTASFLFHTGGFLSSWLADLAAEQYADGAVPHVIPNVNRSPYADDPAAAWGDAAALVPWTVFQRTGDVGVLERQLPSMRAWVDRAAELAGPDRLWAGGFQFGDWLDPAAPPEDAGDARADRDVVATAHLARSAAVVAAAASAVGQADVAAMYGQLADEVRTAFTRAFVTPAGRILSDAPTVYALALDWDLLPSDQRTAAGHRLADLVRQSGFRIATGFVGTPLICDALTKAGHVEVAYRLLLQTHCPSWLYPVTMGATTVWERWDSMLPDGSINPGGMTSFNHYALGAVADWMHRVVAGLAPAAPGYRHITVEPRPTAALGRAQARHLTPYGEAAVSWSRAGGVLTLEVVVPVGATAEVHVPGAAGAVTVTHGRHTWQVVDHTAEGPDMLDWSSATIRDLIDHEQTWNAVVEAADRAAYPIADGATLDVELARKLGRWLDRPARDLAEALAPDGHWPYAFALRRELLGVVRAPEPATT